MLIVGVPWLRGKVLSNRFIFPWASVYGKKKENRDFRQFPQEKMSQNPVQIHTIFRKIHLLETLLGHYIIYPPKWCIWVFQISFCKKNVLKLNFDKCMHFHYKCPKFRQFGAFLILKIRTDRRPPIFFGNSSKNLER